MPAARISKAKSVGFVSVLSFLFGNLAGDFCWTLDCSTPGPTSFAKFVIILFSEFSIGFVKMSSFLSGLATLP